MSVQYCGVKRRGLLLYGADNIHDGGVCPMSMGVSSSMRRRPALAVVNRRTSARRCLTLAGDRKRKISNMPRVWRLKLRVSSSRHPYASRRVAFLNMLSAFRLVYDVKCAPLAASLYILAVDNSKLSRALSSMLQRRGGRRQEGRGGNVKYNAANRSYGGVIEGAF